MTDILCPKCGESNPAELENCQFCGVRLKPLSATTPVDSQPIKVGEDPVKINTSVFEKEKPAKGEPVHAGEAPTKKDTAALEQTLPSWLRSLRESKDSAEGKSTADASPDQDLPLEPTPVAGPESFDDQPDWLSGLGKTVSDNQEEIPGWLTSLGVEKSDTSAPTPSSVPGPALKVTGSLSVGMGDDEWEARLSSQLQSATLETKPLGDLQGNGEAPEFTTPETAPLGDLQGNGEAPEFTTPETAPLGDLQGNGEAPEFTTPETAPLGDLQGNGESPESETPETAPLGDLQGETESPDWLSSLKPETVLPSTPEQPVAPQDEGLHEWLSDIPDSLEENKPTFGAAESPPDWLNQLKEENPNLESTRGGNEEIGAGSVIPDWLSNLGPMSGTPEAVTGENLPEWLASSEAKTGSKSAAPKESGGESLPEWLSNLEAKTGQESAAPEAVRGESLPEWLSGLETKTGSESVTPAPISSSELPSSSAARDEIPKWLSQFQADVDAAAKQEAKKEQFELAPSSPAKREGTGPLPDWLAGIERSTKPSDGIPALITNDEGTVPEGKGGAAFSMEMPDWLSKLKPEQAPEKTLEGTAETSTPANLEVSQLPSWVQAMRPVESVVAETKVTPQEDTQVTEQNGPLAGLLGVLPVSPGLGLLRKPPVYSPFLQVTDGQQRHAASFERLISNETQPLVTKRTRLASNRLWRWLIASLLILSIGLPLSVRIPVTQVSNLQPPEMVNAFNLIGSLRSNAPVLMVFDYDPALSGELEAAAAPLMDHLLLQDPRLALISTSPTGPVLGERFLHDTSASPLVAGHNYQAGQQYVNLGYLAGGPSGVQYFAASPTEAAPFTLDGQKAWQLPPLQGVHGLSDFAAIIVLTDNADSGRVWIEQTGSSIGNTPMLMVISAQAEPMILPYYDSKQIKGLVTGLAGGEAYEQIFISPDAQTSLAQRYWNSFSIGTLVAEIIIIVGALWSAIAGWRARREKSGKGF